MRIRLAACCAIFSATSFAAWERTIQSGKGQIVDNPPPHPLAYFQLDPCARPETDELEPSFSCTPTPSSPSEAERRTKITTRLVEVGTIAGFKVYDLWYTRRFWCASSDYDARSVLIKTGEDEFRELQATELCVPQGGLYVPTEILKGDGEPLLVVGFHDGGQNSFVYRTPYVFRNGVPEKADMRPVDDSIRDLTPLHMSAYLRTDDYHAMTATVNLYRDDTNQPHVLVGEQALIRVTFRIVGGKAIVTSSKYEPYLQ